jgi:multidrug efflux system outer membrane protein
MSPVRNVVFTAAMLGMLGGCASVSPDGGVKDVQTLAAGRTGGVEAAIANAPTLSNQKLIADLLAQPLDAGAAVRIALLNNPGLHASLATLGISDAQRAQMGRLPNPSLALGRLTQGDTVEIERVLRFDVLGLLTLPWRAQWAGRQNELAQLQAAQDVVKLAADTRKAWINAVASQQTVRYMRDVKEAAQAGSELAQRLSKVGNWSRLNQAREQVFLVDATAQLARSEQVAFACREQLNRLLGLWGEQTLYRLPDRLPDLPEAPRDISNVEAQAIRERLDVRSAISEATYVAESQGFFKVSGFVNALDVSITHNTISDNLSGTQETKRGLGVELPLPLFDWGQARSASSQYLYLQSVARVREVGVRARSEAREAYHGYRTAFDLARYYRDAVVPLHQFISDEMLLRYSGMISSIFELLADARRSVLAVNASIDAQRDFWLADTDLQTTLNGTSPGGLAVKTGSPVKSD